MPYFPLDHKFWGRRVAQKRVQILKTQNPKFESQLGISRQVTQPL